jgi:hypothetical protein
MRRSAAPTVGEPERSTSNLNVTRLSLKAGAEWIQLPYPVTF